MADDVRPRLLLLDGHSLAYRAFYALPVQNFSTTTGQPTNAVYGFTSMLINALRDEDPTHIAVAFDVSRVTHRSERFEAYKATRSSSPPEFAGQVDLIRQVLDAMGITSIAVDGFEADDVIATLTTQAEAAGFDVDVITGDRDAFQLVDDHVCVLYPVKGVSELARFTPSALEEKYGLTPAQYADYAALRGDPSDNLPGIPGVGEKTASKWIREYGGLDALLDQADSVGGKVGESLREHLGQVRLNRELTELVRDVELDVTVPELERSPLDRGQVHEVFDALQFRVLRDRLFDVLGEDVAAGDQAAGVAAGSELALSVAARDDEVADWLGEHVSGRDDSAAVGVAFLGTWGAGTGSLQAMALATADGQALLVPLDQAGASIGANAGAVPASLAQWLADPGSPKVGHDVKGPMLALMAQDVTLRGLAADTALMAYLLLPGQRSFSLPDLSSRFLGRELAASTAASGQLSLEGVSEEAQESERQALAQEAGAALELASVMAEQLVERGGADLLERVELPLVTLLARMERAGIAVDKQRLTELELSFGDQMRDAEREAHQIVGREFNLGSPKQLQEILFDEMGLPKTKKIKTGYTTDAEALNSLYASTGNPLLAELLRWRDVSKLRQTVAGLLPLVDDRGRIHTTFNQMVAATGRLSSQDPNLQNIPIRTEAGRQIRGAFVVGDGYESLLTADYSQIEMRLMAHLSADDGLIAAFNSGEDLHTTVAAEVFDVAPADVDAEMRRRIKAMSYGLAYGLSAYGLSQQLGVDVGEAQLMMDSYFERFGGVRDYLHEVVERARATGWTETMLGRRRYLPDLNSSNRQRRAMAERMALNAPIQGSAADLVKIAMLGVDRALHDAGLKSRLLLQVHDELVLEVAPGEAEEVERLVREQMGQVLDLAVPLDVSVGIGPDWQTAGH